MASIGKQTKGRQKITIKRIENEDDRLITFSKRRSGIYKKASELVTLCGAEVGVLVFSPAGKPFSFGHPSIESVANRFLGKNPPSNDNTHPLVEAHRKVRINELNQQHNEQINQLEAEKEREKMLKRMTNRKESRGWWEAPTDELNMQELQQMNAMLVELRNNLYNKINERSNGASSSLLPPRNLPGLVTNPFAPAANETGPSPFPPGHAYGHWHLNY